jgi:hypothetical protein
MIMENELMRVSSHDEIIAPITISLSPLSLSLSLSLPTPLSLPYEDIVTGNHLQAKKSALTRTQPYWHLDLGLQASRAVRD